MADLDKDMDSLLFDDGSNMLLNDDLNMEEFLLGNDDPTLMASSWSRIKITLRS